MSSGLKTNIHLMLGSHMDLFWMAPPRDCLDRGADIINHALTLCQKYKDYCFYIETTVFAEYFLSTFPEKRAIFQQLVDENRLEIGACYVDRYEHMHGGESIVRQYTYGKKYLLKELGRDVRGVCHSDLPGLSPQLPQICALAGIDYYIRARGPMGLFDWRAPDGSSILYASVGYTYGRLTGQRLRREIESAPSIQQRTSYSDYLIRGGYGDLEMPDTEILADVERFNTQYPDIHCAVSTPQRVLAPYIDNLGSLPQLSGEWPVGWASVAAANVQTFQKISRLENDLLTLEKLMALAMPYNGHLTGEVHKTDWWTVLGRFKGDRLPEIIKPGQELSELWKALMFVQDHNYAGFGGPKSELDRSIILQHADELVKCLTESALQRLFNNIGIQESIHNQKVLFAIPIFNPLVWSRNATITISDNIFQKLGPFKLVDAEGTQADFVLDGKTLRLSAKSLPSLGYKVYYAVPAPATCQYKNVEARKADGCFILENECLRITVDLTSGTVESIIDKRLNEELVLNSVGKRFLELAAYGESGVDVVYGFTGERIRETCISVSLHHADNLSATILIESELNNNRVIKRLTLAKDSEKLDIHIEMLCWGMKDWQVRLCLPFAKKGYVQTRYGVPFCSMVWPETMRGIDEDVVFGVDAFNPDEIDSVSRKHIRDAEKWVDIGYKDYGIVLTTSISPVYIDRNLVEPLLLRTGLSCGDSHVWVLNQGHQCWDFSINMRHIEEMPELAGWEKAVPVLASVRMPQEAALPGCEHSFYSLTGSKVVLTALKPADDASGDVVLRFYNAGGTDGEVLLHCPLPVRQCHNVNLLEGKGDTADCSGQTVRTSLRSHEIKSLRIQY